MLSREISHVLGAPITVLTSIISVLAAILGYELLRWAVLRRVRGRLSAGAVAFVRRHKVKLEAGRFIDRVWVREALAQDERIEEAVLRASRTTGEALAITRARADAYVDEIAPYFSLSAYYRLGGGLARLAVGFCYELVLDPAAFEAQRASAPPGAVHVYVLNHRSTGDSLVLSYGLLRKVALSYAVGEWARVWPLDTLFRAFGSYFVRRGEKDPLYHAVLERFVQILASAGVATGFFMEGGLSRDGALRKPKIGLLDYLIGLRKEDPTREIVFMPVGVNYDRVFEDRSLVAELDGPRAAPRLSERVIGLGRMLARAPTLVIANALRVATRSHRKFGYAAVSFGRPLRLTDWPGGAELHNLPDEARKPALEALAAELLTRRVAEVIPATPVPIFCAAILQGGELAVPAVEARVRGVLRSLRAAGAPIALGRAFDHFHHRREADAGVPFLDAEVLDAEEAEQIGILAAALLSRRGILTELGGRYFLAPGSDGLLAYYANSIAHHLERVAEA
ncbi:MAG: 1-acyl-sn-glycerol-3-phosphate acyltransferase [Deltaproteobacteria bacterium]|nr:1-acyl-sn-glycerol-3-phosphate acyltransferase [Deltaproteobacteria bacterium]